MPAAVDYDAIANILTLRYNPRRSPPKRPLAASDFVPAKADNNNVESQALKIIEGDLARVREKRVSVLLSGGVDSVLTLAMLRKFRPDINVSCVSMGFGEDDDEVSAARNIAGIYGCDFRGLVLDDVLIGLPRLVKIAGEPRWNLYQAYAFEACREKTIFSGDGGDELFAGYTFRYQKYLSFLPEKAGWKEKARLYVSCHERDWVPDQEKVFGPKVRFSWDRIYGLLKHHFNNSRLAPLDQVFLADWNGKLLFDWLPANLAFSKAFGIKIQSLFLSGRMTKFATHLPWQVKYDPQSATGKLPLRAILKGERLHMEPVKKGFSANSISLWKKRDQEITKQYVNNSGDSEVVRAGIISGDWVQKTTEKLLAQEEPDVRYVNKMLALLALEVWWRLFVSKTMKGSEKL